ncbi:PEP-CTERM sorting domain-containing protein [Pantanalinema rosaneae CENA516]|uniref:PEP-CTERM sorting domain-containing protein n=1 Tax=Pantanalinema rosaneae TaxID=1620701 RepID=UPI003D6F4B65
MMSIGFLQKITATTVSAAAGVAIVSAIGGHHQAQAASFTYTSTFSLSQVTQFGNFAIGNGNFSFVKEDLPTPAPNGGTVGYELLSFAATILGTPYNLPDLVASPTLQAQALSINSLFPAKYQGILPRVLAQNPNDFDYIGDGDFPPADFNELLTYGGTSYQVTFASTFVENPSPLVALFQPGAAAAPIPSEATPEPTTMLGLGLAGAGLAAARRRRKQQA